MQKVLFNWAQLLHVDKKLSTWLKLENSIGLFI